MSQKDYSFLGEGITSDLQVKVFNNSGGRVGYSLEEPRVRREFAGIGHMQIITFDELYALKHRQGGMDLLLHFLQIRDNKVREALDLPMDPEYLYTPEDVKKLVLQGTKDQLLDAVEFGPYGLSEVIRSTIYDLKIDSSSRIELLSDALGLDLKRIYENGKEDKNEAPADSGSPKRRSQPITADEAPAKKSGRRASSVEA